MHKVVLYVPDSWSNWNLKMLVFEDRRKPEEYPEKTSRSKGENQQQTQHSHMALTPGFEPGPHCWEASALTAAPSLPPPPSPHPPEQEKDQEMMSGISVFN